MKQALIIFLAIIGLSIGFYHATIHYLPNYVYYKFHQKATKLSQRKVNQINLLSAPDENSRMVVKPNPDFEYGSAFFDVSSQAISITGTLPDSTYWSVAFYQPNTVNFYVKNDQQYNSNELDIILTKKKIDGESKEQVISPTNKGFFLLRVLIADRSPENQDRVQQFLKSLSITEIGNAY